MSVETDVATMKVKVGVLEQDYDKLEKATLGTGKTSHATRLGRLERVDLTSSVTRTVLQAVIAALITAIPFIVAVLPKVQQLTEALERHAPAPQAGKAP